MNSAGIAQRPERRPSRAKVAGENPAPRSYFDGDPYRWRRSLGFLLAMVGALAIGFAAGLAIGTPLGFGIGLATVSPQPWPLTRRNVED